MAFTISNSGKLRPAEWQGCSAMHFWACLRSTEPVTRWLACTGRSWLSAVIHTTTTKPVQRFHYSVNSIIII